MAVDYIVRRNIKPIPKSGDAIDYTIINVKTSSKGNPYTNVKNVSIADNHTLDDDLPTDNHQPQQQSRPMPVSNGMNKNDTQRMDIFVTGVVGRSMGSGHFSVEDISDLTKNAVRAFNDNLKKYLKITERYFTTIGGYLLLIPPSVGVATKGQL